MSVEECSDLFSALILLSFRYQLRGLFGIIAKKTFLSKV